MFFKRLLVVVGVDFLVAPLIVMFCIFVLGMPGNVFENLLLTDDFWTIYFKLHLGVFGGYIMVYWVLFLPALVLSRNLDVRQRALVRIAAFCLWVSPAIILEIVYFKEEYGVRLSLKAIADHATIITFPLVWAGLISTGCSEFVWERFRRPKSIPSDT